MNNSLSVRISKLDAVVSLLMMPLSKDPTDDEIFSFIDAWIDDLARGDYAAAYRRTKHDPYYEWTPELMQRVVEGYGLPEPHRSGRIFRVTPRASATGGPPERSIDREEAYTVVWYNIPLNGEWSDLTATLRLEPCDAATDITLEEIHVF